MGQCGLDPSEKGQDDIMKIKLLPEFERFSRKKLKINDIAAGSFHTMILTQPERLDPTIERE